MPTGDTHMFPAPETASVEADGRRFAVAAPTWAAWQSALEQAAPDGTVDEQRVVEECLRACVREGLQGRGDLRELSRDARSGLMGQVMELIDWQRTTLDLRLEAHPDGALIRGDGIRLRLRPWSFGERNDALRQSLRLHQGEVSVDLAAFERAMVLCCAAGVNGEQLTPEEVAAWPVPLGEAVLQALDGLNGLEADYTEVLQACVKAGREHPDLQLAELCKAFGWAPAQALDLDGRTAERLLIGLRAAKGAGSPKRLETKRPAIAESQVAPAAFPGPGEGVTRIVVTDD